MKKWEPLLSFCFLNPPCTITFAHSHAGIETGKKKEMGTVDKSKAGRTETSGKGGKDNAEEGTGTAGGTVAGAEFEHRPKRPGRQPEQRQPALTHEQPLHRPLRLQRQHTPDAILFTSIHVIIMVS